MLDNLDDEPTKRAKLKDKSGWTNIGRLTSVYNNYLATVGLSSELGKLSSL